MVRTTFSEKLERGAQKHASSTSIVPDLVQENPGFGTGLLGRFFGTLLQVKIADHGRRIPSFLLGRNSRGRVAG